MINIFNVLSHAQDLVVKGNSFKASGIMVNAEALASAIYGILSAVIMLLSDFGYNVNIGGTDLHTISNGWGATAALVYSFYRVATNPNAGITPK